MHQYCVIATNPETALVAVKDAAGRCHLGRALAAPPPPGTDLRGDPPEFGVRSLRLAQSEQPCPVVLVLLDCQAETAVRLLRL